MTSLPIAAVYDACMLYPARTRATDMCSVPGVSFPVPGPDACCHCTSFDAFRPVSRYRPGVVPNARRNMSMNALTLS